MQETSKRHLLSIAKDRVDQAARSLVTSLQSSGNYQQSISQPCPKSHFDQWREGMTWRSGFRDNPNEMLQCVESYAKYLVQKIKDVRELQVAYDELKMLSIGEPTVHAPETETKV